MIIRFWRAVAGSDEVLSAYADHLRKTTFVEMAALPGHLGATLARKVRGTDNELVVMSFWDDMASAGHFMKGGMLDSQLATLEPLGAGEAGLEVVNTGDPDDVVADAVARLRALLPDLG